MSELEIGLEIQLYKGRAYLLLKSHGISIYVDETGIPEGAVPVSFLHEFPSLSPKEVSDALGPVPLVLGCEIKNGDIVCVATNYLVLDEVTKIGEWLIEGFSTCEFAVLRKWQDTTPTQYIFERGIGFVAADED